MNISTKRGLKGGKICKINLPNLANNRYLVPNEISVYQIGERGEKVPVKNISLSVMCGNASILTNQPAYFQLTNSVDLTDFQHKVAEGCNMELSLTNNTTDHRDFYISTQYKQTYGNIIYQNSYNEFGNVMNDIHSAGLCTRLVLNFNRPVKGAELVSIVNKELDDEKEVDTEWFDSLELGDTDENSYVIDLTEEGFSMYSQYLNFMKLVIPKDNEQSNEDDDDDEEQEELKLYVVAYGFPYSRH